MNFWLIQALGLLGSLIVFSSVQFNNRKIILLAQAAACALWLVHYSLLGAATAAATNIICFARSAVFYFNDRPWAKSKLWLALFLVLFAANSIVTWEGARSILPARGRRVPDGPCAVGDGHEARAPAVSVALAILAGV